MRFGRHHPAQEDEHASPQLAPYTAPAEEPSSNDLFAVTQEPTTGPVDTAVRELFVRHARKDGRVVAVLRAVDQGPSCVVEAEVWPYGSTHVVKPGPYTFSDAHQASAFVTEAVTALMYLGCDIQAN
jgi:hypothetical protein